MHGHFMVEAQLQVFDGVILEGADNTVFNSYDFIYVLAYLINITLFDIVSNNTMNQIVFFIPYVIIFCKGFFPKIIGFVCIPVSIIDIS